MLRDKEASSSDFRDLDLKSFFSDTGREIFESFVYPALTRSVSYDRLTGYFSVSALVAAAQGLEGLFRNGGRMRLVIGIHDVPEELLGALAIGKLLPSQLVEDYKSRLVNEIGFLKSQAEKNTLSTVGWMIRSGLLEVRVAAPRSSRGIYHQKRMIFRDALDHTIVGTGSLNETFGGQGNVEEMQFNFSWLSSPELITPLVDSFEDIWQGRSDSVELFPLDESFATRMLARLGNPPNSLSNLGKNSLAAEILSLARSSPAFVPFNLSNAALYPHQERVFIEALSRWPIRVMLADEVGLGKTLEAGAVISYMIKFGGVDSVSILAPKGLLRQWQEEMTKHFGLDFHRWDSSIQSYVAPDKSIQPGGFLGSINSPAPRLRLISSQWARIHEQAIRDSLPQMLLVDEAHAARVHRDQYGVRTTKLWDLLNGFKDEIPHVVLLTATPMQVQPGEYHGLLQILGLAPDWSEYDNYELSLHLISQSTERPTLQNGSDLGNLILASIDAYEWLPSHLVENDLILIMNLKDASNSSALDQSLLVQNSFLEYRNLLMKIHPAHFLTCRNTKSGLEEFGYKFPERVFHAPALKMEGILSAYEDAVETYLSMAYGDVEAALTPDGKHSIAFAKSGYYQRMVSSFYASKQSLLSRIDKISAIQLAINSGDFSGVKGYVEEDEFEVDDQNDEAFSEGLDVTQFSEQQIEAIVVKVNRAARLERSYMNDLLHMLDSLGENVIQSDPKFKSAMECLNVFVEKSPVLVFSRYTDTLDGVLKHFEAHDLSKQVRGYALYTGPIVWIQTAMGRRVATKGDVTDALDAGEIQIVFCSDAASEGLNLQSAECILNLDVPWNPARLEQRIGRIARLGQKAKEVHIINLWYPNSIEAKMYSRLLSRRDDYQLAVGEFPEIFSSAIRTEVASVLSDPSGSLANPLVELQELRNSFQRIALEAVWKLEQGHFTPSQLFRDDLMDFVKRAGNNDSNWSYKEPLDASPGERGSLTLLHEVLDQATAVNPITTHGEEVELVGFESNAVFWGFGIRNSSGFFRIIRALSLARLLRAAMGMDELDESDFVGKPFPPEEALKSIQMNLELETWLPKHRSSKVPFAGPLFPAPGILSNPVEVLSIGRVIVGGDR
jgi:superfamily II DNA or RNA helicase